MALYRGFGAAHGWEVLGLHQDLSQRYPVAPLLAADSAQAELAVSGPWEEWSAIVASVLVRPDARSGPRAPLDTVVQLTILDTGPFSPQFTATLESATVDVALLSGRDEQLLRLERVLQDAAGGSDLWPGDHLAADEVELLHTRTLTTGDPDLAGPLRLLSTVARALA